MTNTVETSEELIARARELCGEEKALATHDLVMAKTRKQIKLANTRLRMVTTHLAEMEEHEIVSVLGVGATCTCGATYFYYPEIPTVCHKAVTKAKSLLGVTE